MAYCKECGTHLHDGSRMCVRCGKRLDPRQIERHSQGTRRILNILVGVGVAAGALVPRIAREFPDWLRSSRIPPIAVGVLMGVIVMAGVLFMRSRSERPGRRIAAGAKRDRTRWWDPEKDSETP